MNLMGKEVVVVSNEKPKPLFQNNMAAFICLGIGFSLILVSLIEIPSIWIDPIPFVKHVTIGSMFGVLGVSFFIGPFEYLKSLLSKEK